MHSDSKQALDPHTWKTVTLGELCDEGGGGVQTGPFGSQLHASDYVAQGVPSIMPVNISVEGVSDRDISRVPTSDAQRLEKYRVRDGDIVYSRRGDVERCALVSKREEGWLCGTGCLRVRLGESEISPTFLHAYLSSGEARQWIVQHAVGATMPNLNTTILRSLPIALPPERYRTLIGELWSALQSRVQAFRKESDALHAMQQLIFRSWFVDFDPVRAKAEGREPDGMDAATAAIFPSEFQESELGRIPKGWKVTNVGDLCTKVSMGPFGSNIKTDNFVSAGVPVVRGGNLKRGFIDYDFVYVTETKASELRNSIAHPGDIVITHRGTLGQVGLIPENSRFERYLVSQSQMLLSVDRARSSPMLLYLFLTSSDGQQRLLANTSQTGVPAIARPTASVKAIKIIAPSPIALMSSFDEIAKALFQRITANDYLVRNLSSLRDTLLPRLISGKLRIPEAEKLVASAL